MFAYEDRGAKTPDGSHSSQPPSPSSCNGPLVRVQVIESSQVLGRMAAQLICQALEQQANIVASKSATDALQLFYAHSPSLIVLDASAEGAIGFIQYVWQFAPRTKILFWSLSHKESLLRHISRVGRNSVFGYVLKSRGDEHFVNAIKSMMKLDNGYIDPAVRLVSVPNEHSEALTQSEYETLLDMAAGYTDKAIAARRNMSVRGIQNRIALIFQKLLGPEQDLGAAGIINLRVRVISEAARRGLIDFGSLPKIVECELEE